MPRIRTVKPEFFKHEGLYDLEQEMGLPMRLAYEGLWCCADREGRFEWRPRRLKTDILPYDDVDFSRVLDALSTRGYLVRYASGGAEYGWIPTFLEHQIVNNRERDSILPSPPDVVAAEQDAHACPTRAPRPLSLAQGEGEGEGEGEEEEHPPPAWVSAVLEDWISVTPLPSRAQPEACLKVFHDLHRLDKRSPEEIATVCAWIVRNKVPTYIKSPLKLRRPTKDGDCQTFEMYAGMMSTNGKGAIDIAALMESME